MSLAEEMRNVADATNDENENFNILWNMAKEKIMEEARKGRREMTFSSIPFYKYTYMKNLYYLKQEVIRRLEKEGFKLRYGGDIGKPIYNRDVLYLVW